MSLVQLPLLHRHAFIPLLRHLPACNAYLRLLTLTLVAINATQQQQHGSSYSYQAIVNLCLKHAAHHLSAVVRS